MCGGIADVGVWGTERGAITGVAPITHIHIMLPSFPTQDFPSEIQPYRPPQAIKDAHMSKITSCDDVFAALSSNGEVFSFSVPNLGSTMEGLSSSLPSSESRVGGGALFKPQRVWALRKKFSAVKVSSFVFPI
jgi:hypothetical protein